MSPLFEREPNFEEKFKVGDRFVLMGLRYTGSIATSNGSAHRSLVTAITRESYPKRITYSALGVGFKNMAERATPSDFPVVVEYIRVPLPGNRDVKRFAPVTWEEEPLTPADFVKNGIDGDPIDMEEFASPTGADMSSASGDDPGF